MNDVKIKIVLFALIILLPFYILSSQDIPKENRLHVGDIPFDPVTDNPDFVICNEANILPYNTQYGMFIEGERYRVLQYFKERYVIEPIKGQTGYITIRFLVNCQGETDRFRVYEMGQDMKETVFDPIITQTLLRLTKKLDGWKVPEHLEVYDYYQYLLFKLNDGQIETILP